MKYTTVSVILLSILPSYNASGKLLVLLIDGLRYDYLDNLDSLPGFREFIKNGVKVDYLTPEFPSLTYPNLYSLMTGRHTEAHHMTGNYMWDMDSGKVFNTSDKDSGLPLWWDGAEPLWVTMRKLNKSVYMYNWPGCEVKILGMKASYCEPFNKTGRNLNDTLELALSALRNGSAEMAAVYYLELDTIGHFYGPLSNNTNQNVVDLDYTMNVLNKQILAKNMSNDLNTIMFSDHGMLEFMHVIELDTHIKLSDVIKVLDIGAVVSLWPKQEKFEEIFTNLSAVGNMTVYRRSDIPDRFHYKEGRFVSTLTLVAKPGWIITPNRAILETEFGAQCKNIIQILQVSENKSGLPFQRDFKCEDGFFGAHGYDNELVEMRGFFVAKGPDFKSNFSAGPIRAVDVYNVMCHTLGIDPLPNNGSFDRVKAMLNGSSSITVPISQHSWFLFLLSLFAIFAVQISL